MMRTGDQDCKSSHLFEYVDLRRHGLIARGDRGQRIPLLLHVGVLRLQQLVLQREKEENGNEGTHTVTC